MAKGYPDFFGQSIFPYYGPLIEENNTIMVTGPEYATLIDLDMKGVVAGGIIQILLTAGASEDHSYFDILVDGDRLARLLCSELLNGVYTIGINGLVHTTDYDVRGEMYRCEITHDINFGERFQINVGSSWGGQTPEFYSSIHYYQVI